MTWDTLTTSWGVDTTLAPFSFNGSHLLSVRLDTAQTIRGGELQDLRLSVWRVWVPYEPWMEAQARKIHRGAHIPVAE